MNGMHDMGGMQGVGPIGYETTEPVFHASWEARIYALSTAVQGTGRLTLGLRPPIESMPPLEYLRSSYYEKFYVSITERLVASGVVTRAELECGIPEAGSAKADWALSPAAALAALMKNPPTRRDLPVAARFHVGERVRARNIHPVTHTRLPRYVRGKSGNVVRDHGIFVFSDTSVYGQGEKPQHIYSVRFAAREIWGEQAAPQDSVYLDLFDDYLEAV